MKWQADPTTGYVWIDALGDEKWIRLRRPRVREWAEWSDALATQDRSLQNFKGDGYELENALLLGKASILNEAILQATLVAPLAMSVEQAGQFRLAINDRELTRQLIDFWRDHPLSPWLTDGPSDPDAKIIRSHLSGGLASLAVLYRALLPAGLGPPEIDQLELWQAAVLLGRDSEDDDSPETRLHRDIDDGSRRRKIGGRDNVRWGRKRGLPFIYSEPNSAAAKVWWANWKRDHLPVRAER